MEALHLVVEEVADFLQHGHRIGFFLGVLAQLEQFLKQLIHIGKVEIASQQQVAGYPVILAQERVACFDTVVAMGAIAQMPEQQLPHIRHVLFEPGRVVKLFRRQPLEMEVDLVEHILQVVARNAALAADVLLPRRYIQLDGGHAGAILPTVALFLHQQL